MNVSNPLWYKEFKKDDIWTKKVRNQSHYDFVKIISFVNTKKRKYVNIELPTDQKIKVEVDWLFSNYEKPRKGGT